MRKYWKVHIDNFDLFINHIYNMYDNMRQPYDIAYCIKIYYTSEKYLYLLLYDGEYDGEYKISLTYSNCYNNVKFLSHTDWKYMGEYNNRLDKLKKLDEISKIE